MFNGNPIPGAKEPLLVKFADGGNKKKALYKQNDNNSRAWRENAESITQVNTTIPINVIFLAKIKMNRLFLITQYTIKNGVPTSLNRLNFFACTLNRNKCFLVW